jgi:hypothetical protein
LTGCATDNVGTLDAGAALPRAQYQILGKTKYDQAWVDKTIEGEVAGFHFARPQKRPPSMDTATVVVTPAKAGPLPVITPSTPAVVTVKPSWRDRIKGLNDKVKKLEGR